MVPGNPRARDRSALGDPSVSGGPTAAGGESERMLAWASTMDGFAEGRGLRVAHAATVASLGRIVPYTREEREADEDRLLAPGATRAAGAGSRPAAEEPDALRTCFERDRDRILHSSAFRRLAGKTQVFVFPDDHQRTRLTHALEVAQVATSIARSLRLNVALAEAIALGHDCGHGPGGHASEDAFASYLPEGYDHAVWGADVVLAPLNLTTEVLDGIRNHSWSRPAPSTPEGEVVSWADRIAYSTHDLEDAATAGLVRLTELPSGVAEVCGVSRGEQLAMFIFGVVEASTAAGIIAMSDEMATALGVLRRFNYDRVYMRPDSVAQGLAVRRVLAALVEHFATNPGDIGAPFDPGTPQAVRSSVGYVAGMTDRYACESALRLLDWPVAELPVGFDVPRHTTIA